MFDTPRLIPRGLDEMEPGPALAAFLMSVEPEKLSGRDRLVVLRAHQRMASHYQAQAYADMAEVVEIVSEKAGIDLDSPDGLAEAAEIAAAEIRAALRLTRRAAERELETALALRTRLPQVHAAFLAGDIDGRRADVILWETAHLPAEEARRTADTVLPDASWMTTGQLRCRLRRVALEVAPDAAEARYHRALDDRRVVLEPGEDGTAALRGVNLPPERAVAARERVESLARELRRGGDPRTLDQLRADVFLDLLCGTDAASGSQPAGRRGTVDLVVDLTTLAGLADTPGELRGYGPVIAEIARKVADDQGDARWRYRVVDEGRTVTTGALRRRPTAAQRRAVTLRDGTCVFPGCRMPAVDADLDHRVRWADGGPTAVDNLAAVCRHDHRLRHDHGWSHEMLPNGDHRWTSPLGQRVTTWGTDGRVPVRPP